MVDFVTVDIGSDAASRDEGVVAGLVEARCGRGVATVRVEGQSSRSGERSCRLQDCVRVLLGTNLRFCLRSRVLLLDAAVLRAVCLVVIPRPTSSRSAGILRF